MPKVLALAAIHLTNHLLAIISSSLIV